MKNTNSKIKELEHCELKIRPTMEDYVAIARHSEENGYRKFSVTGNRIFTAVYFLVIFLVAIIFVMIVTDYFYEYMKIGSIRFFVCLIIGLSTVFMASLVSRRKLKITKEDLAEALAKSMVPYGEGDECYSVFNFGEKGFSTDAGSPFEKLFYEYSAFERVIECELGIIMILDDVYIYAIPARFFDDDSACFLTKRLRKECGRKFITTGKMKIEN